MTDFKPSEDAREALHRAVKEAYIEDESLSPEEAERHRKYGDNYPEVEAMEESGWVPAAEYGQWLAQKVFLNAKLVDRQTGVPLFIWVDNKGDIHFNAGGVKA